MHLRSLSFVLLASLALAQTGTPPPSKPAVKTASPAAAKPGKPAVDNSSVAPGAAVITVKGVCNAPAAHAAASRAAAPKAASAAKSTADCKTIITRAQFEALADALQPNMNAATRKQLASFYPKVLLYAQEARKRGLDKDPKFKQVEEFNHLQTLAKEFVRVTQEKAKEVPDAEIEKYYKANDAAYEQVGLLRIYVPRDKVRPPAGEEKTDAADKDKEKDKDKDKDKKEVKKIDPAKEAEIEKADEEAMKKEAESVQSRAAAGGDFEKLQKEAYDMAGLQGTPPNTSIGKLMRSELPANHRVAMDLKPGEVSSLLVEGNGYYIYKVISKDIKPLDQVKDQIRGTLAQQHLQDAMQKIEQSGDTELNEAYFTPPAPPAPPGRPAAAPGVMGQRPASPPAGAPAATAAPATPADSKTPPDAATPNPKK